MQHTEHITIDAPLEQVWKTAAHDFDKIGLWSAGVSDSKPLANGTSSSELGGRVCATKQGETTERFITYDDDRHTFTYQITGDAMPGFVAKATNRWTAEAVTDQQSRLTMAVTMETSGLLGRIMQFPMQRGMSKLLRENLEELKHYIETGTAHPRKVKASKGSRR